MPKSLFFLLIGSMLIAVIPSFVTGGINGLTFLGLLGIVAVALFLPGKERS